MEKLLRGIVDFRKNKRPELLPLFKELAENGQKPDVLFFACADSRVVPNLVVSTEPPTLVATCRLPSPPAFAKEGR